MPAAALGREGYQVHTLYSGLPASTPGVQGELFYGVRTAWHGPGDVSPHRA